MKETIIGAATGDILGHFDPCTETLTDIQGRSAWPVDSLAMAMDIMRDSWSWNV